MPIWHLQRHEMARRLGCQCNIVDVVNSQDHDALFVTCVDPTACFRYYSHCRTGSLHPDRTRRCRNGVEPAGPDQPGGAIMTQREIIEQLKKLAPAQRLAIVEATLRSIREELA